HGRAETRRGQRAIASNGRRWRRNWVETNSIARVVMDDIWRRSNQSRNQVRSRAGGAHTLRWRRAGIRLDCEQVGHSVRRGRELQVRGIDHLGDERFAARNFDGLSAMVRFLPSGLARSAGLGSAEILGARQFVAAVIDHVMTGDPRHDIWAEIIDFYL